MTRSPYDDHSYDINAAIRRSTAVWTTDTSRTACEGAFLDRATLAREVVRLRGELAVMQDELTFTQQANAEAETEIDHLTEQQQPPEEQP